MDDKNNENDFDDVDFEEFDDEFADDEDLLADDDLDVDAGQDFAPEDDTFAAADDDMGDDLGDDDWGDEDLDDAADEPSNTKKGSSSSKLLLPVLALVAIAGGGGYYYTQILNGPQAGGDAGMDAYQQAQNDMNEPQPEMDIAIPMPSPITEPVDDGFDEQPPQPSLSAIEEQYPGNSGMSMQTGMPEPEPQAVQQPEPDNGVLTPMPNIASLDENTTSDTIDEPAMDSMSMDSGMDSGFDDGMNNLDLSAPTEMPPIEDTQNAELTAAEPDMPQFNAPPPAADPVIEVMEEPVQPIAEPANQQAMAEMDNQNQELNSRISDLENSAQQKEEQISSLSSEIEALKKQLSQKDAELEQSQTRIAELEKTLKEEKSSSSSAQNNAPAAKPAPTPTQTAQPAAKPKPPAPAIVASPMPQWELRSAQPGKAYVAIKNSNNVLVVETGDTLQGIGRIQSIAVENSLWVVRGTQGKIVQ